MGPLRLSKVNAFKVKMTIPSTETTDEEDTQLKQKCCALLEDLDEGDITIKGYCKSKLKILESVLPAPLKQNAQLLISSNKDGKISDEELIQTCNKIFDSVMNKGGSANQDDAESRDNVDANTKENDSDATTSGTNDSVVKTEKDM